MWKNIYRFTVWFYGGLIALFYAVIASGQILGFGGIYRKDLVIPLAFLLSAVCLWFYLKEKVFFRHILTDKQVRISPLIAASLIAAGLFLFAVLVAVPMLRWPASPIGRSLTWDAGAYHFPKAVELFRSGSAWDLSVAYGDYPFGYESLLSFALLLSGDERLFGLIHLLIALYFLLSIWLLACRYFRLPYSLLFLMSVGVLIADIATNPGNPQLISGIAFTIGKNDFLLGTAVLSAILHSPVGSRKNQFKFHLVGLAMSTMLAISIKPNGAIPLIPIWLFTFYLLWKENQHRISIRLAMTITGAGLAIFPGILWALRNYIVLGSVFTPAARALAAESIAANLLNPYLYTATPPFLLLVLVIGITLSAIGLLKKSVSLSPTIALCSLILLITFIFTPATAFHKYLNVPSQIAWRFGISLAIFNLLVFGLMIEGWVDKTLIRLANFKNAALKLISFWVLVGLIFWSGFWLLKKEPQNWIILRDEYKEAVGTDGYHSAYDYIQKNIRNSVIHIENGLLYYGYGPGYTNTPTKLQYPLEMEDRVPQPVPDYFVIFKPDDAGGEFPESLVSSAWLDKWQLIYSDPEGRIYRKIQ